MNKMIILTLGLVTIFNSNSVFASLADSIKLSGTADTRVYLRLKGSYSETIDGGSHASGDVCQIFPKINSSDASFNLNLGDGSENETLPAVIYYIASSGEYKETTGPAGLARREVLDNGTVIYSNPTAYYEGMASCGSLGHIGKPLLVQDAKFIIGSNYVQFVLNYRCGLMGGSKHQIVKTCQY